MNKYIKALSVVLVLSSSVFLPSANAASATSSTDMLINLAENDPALVDRLNDIALTDEKLLNQLLKMSESDPVKLEKLVDLESSNTKMFRMIANIYNVQEPEVTAELQPAEEKEQQIFSTFGAISHGGVIRN